MKNAVETYISELRNIRASEAGTDETSYYAALSTLLNEIGKTAKPRVCAVMNLKNRGAGHPDGGLFTFTQTRMGAADPDQLDLEGHLPARGAIEVKGTSEDAFEVAKSDQVERYLAKYGAVLVTNLRDFVLVGRDEQGKPEALESCQLAKSEQAFWAAARQPRRFAQTRAEGLAEFLRRVMMSNAPLLDPKDVAWFLASYARTARLRLQHRSLPALDQFRQSLEESLGLKFEGEKGDHFFHSTLVQTLFYGVFAAWVLWSREVGPKNKDVEFRWRESAWYLRVPMMRVLFEQFASPSRLGPLGISEVLDWAQTVLNRVDRSEFFRRFEQGQAVQYFYEPFLEAFDPELRKELGVWYTPPEIVRYMVSRVDGVLREDLGIPEGFADPNVYVLDLCCGTGAYLVEVLRTIDRTLHLRGADALTRQEVRRAASQRVFGFEVMPAPFVVAHLQLGLLLKELGVPFEHEDERAAVYLTNSLTGWAILEEQHPRLFYAELDSERDAARHIKQEAPILVVIGNPPYNAFADMKTAEEEGIIEPYRAGLHRWGITKNALKDMYIRFFRLAERRVAEMTGRGVVSFISNSSWLGDPTYVTVREHLLGAFDEFWVDNLHGDRTISEYGPDGKTSQTVFAIRGFSPGIRQGVAVSTWVRRGSSGARSAQVHFRNDVNDSSAEKRRARLLATASDVNWRKCYELASPCDSNRLSFWPSAVLESYRRWPLISELCAVKPMLGLNENRGGSLVDIDRTALEERIGRYLDPEVLWEDLGPESKGLIRNAAGFNAQDARRKWLAAEKYDEDRIARYQIRPFDQRWAYTTDVHPIWNRSRPDLRRNVYEDSEFLVSRPCAAIPKEGLPVYYTRFLGDNDSLRGHGYHIPFMAADGVAARRDSERQKAQEMFLATNPTRKANLSLSARSYLENLGLRGHEVYLARSLWYHVLAVTASPLYLSENLDGVHENWPRIPMPGSVTALTGSSDLGSAVAHLLDTTFPLSREKWLVAFGPISRVGGGTLLASDLRSTARWGVPGPAGTAMPGPGALIERDYSADEMDSLKDAAAMHGLSTEEALSNLGLTTLDVFLNEGAFWKNVPANVWCYTVGGYQVIKKWLSYREWGLLGRPLYQEEVKYVSEVIRRLTALLLLQPRLDTNYLRTKENSSGWAV